MKRNRDAKTLRIIQVLLLKFLHFSRRQMPGRGTSPLTDDPKGRLCVENGTESFSIHEESWGTDMNSLFMRVYLSFCVLICFRTYVNSELYHAEYENSTNTGTCIARTAGYVAFCGSTSYPGEPELELLSFWYHNGWYQHGQLRSSRRATRHHNLRHRL